MFFYLIPIAFVVPTIMKCLFNHEIKTIEWILHTLASIVIAIVIPFALVQIVGHDTEVLNGYVTEKERVYNPKTEYYDCNPHTVTDSKGNSTTVYDTCTRIIPEWDYVVSSTVGTTKISREDIHGRYEPERFKSVVIGEPFAIEKSFLNYLKLSENTLYKQRINEANKYINVIPDYPTIFDYYRYNRVFKMGNVNLDSSLLNNKINDALKDWGNRYQINPIFFLVDEYYSSDFYYALGAKWLGGKKNDVIVVIQLENNNNVEWVRVISRADSEMFNKSLEMDLQNLKDLKIEKLLEVFEANLKDQYKRMDFEKKYSFLENDFSPSWSQILLCIISLLFGSAVVMIGYKYFEKSQMRY